MEPYQQRVVEEKAALDEKLNKLAKFVINGGDAFKMLFIAEQVRLNKQMVVMEIYSEILRDRIAAFDTALPLPEETKSNL